MGKIGFTQKVRELLKEKGPQTPREIKEYCGYLSKCAIKGEVSGAMHRPKDIHYLGITSRGIYYLDGQESDAKKRLEELSLESERRKESRILMIPRNLNYNSVLDVFTDDKTIYAINEVWKIVGGHLSDVAHRLNALSNSNVLIVENVKPKKYRRNPQYAKICDGDYRKASRELFRK